MDFIPSGRWALYLLPYIFWACQLCTMSAADDRIAYFGTDGKVHIMTKAGVEVQRFRIYVAPVWSPDGHWFAFNTECPVSCRIALATSDLKTQRYVSSRAYESNGNLPTWSPDGKQLAYSLLLKHGKLPQIFVSATDGAGAKQITPWPLKGRKFASHPTWSPDGKWIAFRSNAFSTFFHPRRDLFILHPDGSGLQALTGPAVSFRTPGTYRQGTPLCSVDRIHTYEYFYDDTRWQTLCAQPVNYFFWSRDSSTIFYLSQGGWLSIRIGAATEPLPTGFLHCAKEGGWCTNRDIGPAEEKDDKQGTFSAFFFCGAAGPQAWSSDGKQMVCSDGDLYLWEVATGGKAYLHDQHGGRLRGYSPIFLPEAPAPQSIVSPSATPNVGALISK